MRVESIRTLHGPNVYSYRPVLLMRLDLGELVERESHEFNGFNNRLLTLLPGINNHHCSLGRPGGFVTRLQEGTYFGHIVEHVTLSNRSNLSTGATAQDVTDKVHPSIARMSERAARLIGLDVCGVDLVIPDIAEA